MSTQFDNLKSLILNFLKYKLNFNYIAKVISKSKISKKALINFPCHIQDSNIDDYTYVASNSYISNVEIGKFCSIGMNLVAGLGIHPLDGISTSPMFYSTKMQNGVSLVKQNKVIESKRIVIGNDVFIGTNVTIKDGVNIGHGAVIGASSFVNKNVPNYAIFAGNPAKFLRYRFDEETRKELEKVKWWDFDYEKLSLISQSFFDIKTFIEKFKNVK